MNKTYEDKGYTLDPEKYLKLSEIGVSLFIKKNPSVAYLYEDLIGVANVALVEGCVDYEKDQGMSPTTYLWSRISQSLYNFVTRNEWKQRKISPVSVEEFNRSVGTEDLTWEETIDGTLIDLKSFVDRLTDEERKFLELYILTGSLKRSREVLGISWESLSNLKKFIKDKFFEGHLASNCYYISREL